MIVWLRSAAAALCLMACGLGNAPAQQQSAAPDLSTASMEDLTQMQLRVSSFARKDQDLWTTPAAVFVITKEDIERSAATSIPELLRMVPGVQVAQIDASTWAVSARGFNGAFANKLLVLIDGRTVYSEIYSGAHWDQSDLPMEEIERIEVIRGPGAAVWGTNAVNGVINIITKRARSTVGNSASARISRIDGATHVQYGGSLGDHLQYRSYALYTQREPFDLTSGQKAFDGEDSLRGGGRIDWQRNKQDWMTLSGDLYGGHLKQQLQPEFNVASGAGGQDRGSIAGGYLLGRWEHKLPHADTALQFYFDDTSRHELGNYTRTRTLDAEYQDHRSAGLRHDLVWGGGIRFTADHIAGQLPLINEPEFNNYLVDGFVQDEIALIPRRLVLTLGSKVQQGTLAGFQVQPSVRLLWSASEKQSLWGAISRAAVAPAIEEKAVDIPLNLGTYDGLPVTGTLLGNAANKPEIVIAYEAGYRRRLTSSFTFDAASFFNVNQRLESISVQNPELLQTPAPHVIENLQYGNGYRAKTAGMEVAMSWKPVSSFSLQGGYTWTQANVVQADAGQIVQTDTWSTPRNTITGSAFWRFAPGWSLNTFVSYVGALTGVSSALNLSITGEVSAFTRLDLHLARKVGRFTVIDAGGTNLLTPRHLEAGSSNGFVSPSEVPRSIFVRAKWTF